MNIIRITLALLLFSGSLMAQREKPSEEMREKIESMRIAYITEKINLTPEEAQVFWPVYNQYREEFEKIIHRVEPNGKPPHHLSDEELNKMSDKEVREMLTNEMEKQKLLVEHREKYFKKFTEILPIKKVALLYDAEREFQRKLMRQISDRGHEKGK
ncbi:hypothetical protein [Owenweeksia hongkongensis]|uniref:Sensor of ECF-type sigma factor n=1 Tax=Owenweeksia hongkongensis (strain DSM 17368 / CIP 108786 / JCM 12287 / NRRL B-23963 / UST20020801) TaxID=926562 RepID=G8R7J0_OWEHD|nr:hypothetical protein [Owenweeksia hongkongensis]AEV32343.1 hypothetical protein Oweho_1345 [Owenweeksia hongkongensis DSM 17368]